MRIVDHPSLNHDPRPAGTPTDMLILHYTGMRGTGAALDRMCDPAVRVSAHYCIDEDGTVFVLVAEGRRAWHAGVSFWAGARDINGRSIGIELVNPGHEFGYRPFPEQQMRALELLARGILARHPIPARRVLGHSDVAPARKIDPGELFDWKRLARAGIGLWPNTTGFPRCRLASTRNEIAGVQSQLAAFGYEVAVTGVNDQATSLCLSAFQRHFRPETIDAEPDGETRRRLSALLAALPPP